MKRLQTTSAHSLGALALCAAAAAASPAQSAVVVPDTAPWTNVNIGYGSPIRQGRSLRVTPNPAWVRLPTAPCPLTVPPSLVCANNAPDYATAPVPSYGQVLVKSTGWR